MQWTCIENMGSGGTFWINKVSTKCMKLNYCQLTIDWCMQATDEIERGVPVAIQHVMKTKFPCSLRAAIDNDFKIYTLITECEQLQLEVNKLKKDTTEILTEHDIGILQGTLQKELESLAKAEEEKTKLEQALQQAESHVGVTPKTKIDSTYAYFVDELEKLETLLQQEQQNLNPALEDQRKVMFLIKLSLKLLD